MSSILRKIGKTVVGIVLTPFALIGFGLTMVLGGIADLLIGILAGIIGAPLALLIIAMFYFGDKKDERILKFGTPEQKQEVYNRRWTMMQEFERPYGKSGSVY